MPVGSGLNIFETNLLIIFAKYSVLLILFFYSLFSILIVRQVSLMNKTFMTAVSPLLKDLAVYHAIASFILIGLVWKLL